MAVKVAGLILLSYRPNGIDEKTYLQTVGLGLENYSDDVLKALIDPKNGLIAKNKFQPSLAELHEFCQNYGQKTYKEPNVITFEEPKPASKEEKEWCTAFVKALDLGFGDGDPFVEYQNQLKVGERFSVNDQKYIDFCKEYKKRKHKNYVAPTDEDLELLREKYINNPVKFSEHHPIAKPRQYKDD